MYYKYQMFYCSVEFSASVFYPVDKNKNISPVIILDICSSFKAFKSKLSPEYHLYNIL